ncbi:myoD family inhibitor domain-containing protein-like isoform X2 [Cynoglossus semilaevis]|uniref:myoD family inhibitor domain-containing protein-like isoform X2 n=1 Tax=Cynoglossus semilaevis TaxID=244447 RepID=UPI000D626E25|nr:myoD family inhibitor domain-containing protein-like isoform X2 [Cynoglossus semilaevis]
MFPREHLPVDEKKNQSNKTEAKRESSAHSSTRVKSPQEVHPACDPVSKGNAIPTELINTQPQPTSQEGPGRQTCPACPRCGLTVPDLQGSSLSVDSSSSKKKKKKKKNKSTNYYKPAATPDSCFHLLLACLSCQCSVILTGLLDSCSSCLHTFCSSCCRACSRCCAAIQETPVEEINCHAHCHSVLFDSCCEPTECLEFCLDCCDICHRS